MKIKDKADLARKVVKGVRAVRGVVQIVADVADWLDEHILGEDPDDQEKEPKP